MTKQQNGMPTWIDVSTSDLDGAKAFYTKLFGWTYTETREDMGGYTQALKDGKTVAGLYHLIPEMTTGFWSVYFEADDIVKSAQLIGDNGGTVIASPMSVEELGSMCIASDPTGGVFGLWQTDTFSGVELVNETGAWAWEDLRSNDPDVSRDFFTSLFGYRHDDLPMPSPFDYKTFTFSDGERPLGGMGEMFGAPEGTPSHWLVYMKVDDTPAAEATITANGGAVLMPAMATPFGRQALVTDPFGATFAIIDSQTA